MEAINFTPKHELTISNGKEKQFKHRDDGVYEMSIINMGIGEKQASQSHRPCDIALRNMQLHFCLKWAHSTGSDCIRNILKGKNN